MHPVKLYCGETARRLALSAKSAISHGGIDMTYSDKNTTTRQEGVRAAESGAQLRRNPARASAEDASKHSALAQEMADVANVDVDEADESMPVPSRRARRRATEQAESAPVRQDDAPVRRARNTAQDAEPNEEYEAELDEYADDEESVDEGAPRRWLSRGIRRLKSRHASDDDDYESNEQDESDEDSVPQHGKFGRGMLRVLHRHDADEDLDETADDSTDECEAPTKRRSRRDAAHQADQTEYADEVESDEDDEETPTRRRLSRSPHHTALQQSIDRAEDADDSEAEEDETPTRRRLSRSPHRTAYQQPVNEDEADEAEDEEEEEEETTPTRRRLSRSPHRAMQPDSEEDDAQAYEDDYSDDEDYYEDEDYQEGYADDGYPDEDDYADSDEDAHAHRGLSRLFKRRDDDERYEDDVRHADSEYAPRNRFMAWLESMRIVEEVPEDEYGEEYDDYAPDDHDEDNAPHHEARSARKVPVPQGRQRRGETEQLDSPHRSSNHRASERYADDDVAYEEHRHGTKSVRRKSDEDETYEEDRHSVKSARRKLDDDEAYEENRHNVKSVRRKSDDDEAYEEDHRVLKPARRKSDDDEAYEDDSHSSKPKLLSSGADEHHASGTRVISREQRDSAMDKSTLADGTVADVDENVVASAVEPKANNDAVVDAKHSIAESADKSDDVHTQSEQCNDDVADDADVDSHVSRRSRRTQSEAVQSEASNIVNVASPNTEAQDNTLLERYKSADMDGKREILMDYWRDQFPKRMVIPAKPEKLRALEDMVRQILNACADEYALGERWEKINQLLEQYSSAVVAEYGYKSLLNTVRSEEQQRMYGRPKEDKTASSAATAQADTHPREPKIPAQVQQAAQPASDEARQRRIDADHGAVAENDAEAASASNAEPRRVPRVPAAQSRSESERRPSSREPEYDESDIDSRDGEYIDGTSRRSRNSKRDYSDYNFDDNRRRESGVSRFLERAHAHSGHSGDEYEPGASAKGWLRQLFRRGDVLDYSSDEPEHSNSGADEYTDELQSARMESGREQRKQEERDYAAQAASVRKDTDAINESEAGYSRTDYPRSVERSNEREAQRSYSRTDDYSRSDAQPNSRETERSYARTEVREPARDYSRSNEYERSDAQPYARESDSSYSRTSDYTRNAAQTDARESGSAYSNTADYARNDNRAYNREPEREEDYRPPLDRSVYDRNNADYSADRPDYSQDYADNDYMPGGYADSVQSGYSGDYQRAGYSSDGYSRNGYSGDGYASENYAHAGNYDAYYARPNPAGGTRHDYGEREYRTRPQTGRLAQGGEDAEDRWRRCSPTKDDRGGMGAPHKGTEDDWNSAPANGARHLMRHALGTVSTLIFATALAGAEDPEDGSQNANSQSDSSTRSDASGKAEPAQASGKRRHARLRAGGRMRGSRRRWFMLVGAFALLAVTLVLAYGSRVVYDVRQYEGKFYEGIYLDDIALAGMTLDEAAQAVNSANAQRVESIVLQVSYGDEVYKLDSTGLGVELDTLEKLNELWKLGREGNYAQRHNQITQLRAEGVYEYTSYSYSMSALDEFLSDIKADVDLAPRDAKIAFHPNASEKFDISSSAAGREVDISALNADARAVLAKGGGTVELAPKRLEPSFTTEQARACTVKLVTYSTQIRSSNAARTSNVRLALGFYNGLTVQPGEQIDFNKLVGNRTEARGFKPAPEYSNGEIVEGIGGGVCQASTTLYGALLRAGMRIDERYNHSMTVGYVPLSQDAAVVYPGKSLTFTNTTGYPAFFTTSVTSDTATVTIYGYDIYPGKSVSIVSETISVDKAKVNTYADPNYQYTTKPGEEVMVTTPSDGVTSRAYRVLIDDATGKGVSRETLSKDTYRRRDGVMYRGGE